MAQKTPITVAFGDGIGPEIMDATLRVLYQAGAEIAIEAVQIGEQVYDMGYSSGIEPNTWDIIRKNKVFLKAPITTPQGGGFKSLNVTVRKTLGLFSNVRPCVSYAPFVKTKHPVMDVVIIRENEEDLYAGIEHRQTEEVYQCLKLITVPGCERIIRYAFEYAKQNNRKKVTCFTKDNIMKLTDGLFHKTFDRIALEYPDITAEHWIVDIGAAKLADSPENFDVIVMPNLYGDILSDVAAQITGSVGLAGSANIGEHCAMFEAIHGSAPKHAGKNTANPSGLLLAAVMMLVHIGQPKVAEKIHNAWLSTIEEGIHTQDIYKEGISHQKVGTKEFAEAVVQRLGKLPQHLNPVVYKSEIKSIVSSYTRKNPAKRELVGVDIFLNHIADKPVQHLAKQLQAAAGNEFELKLITNRGVKVWPEGIPETFCTDHWRCRFKLSDPKRGDHNSIIKLLEKMVDEKLDFIKTEHLYNFDEKPGYSLGQGE
ncbi:MAG: NADP-dependent isocitrate dehydrogenase [Gammaproteobacteria bacterium]|nr:NADP-dependent isocitrate dehydrogenase [Gammaproteobacteria bacterium]